MSISLTFHPRQCPANHYAFHVSRNSPDKQFHSLTTLSPLKLCRKYKNSTYQIFPLEPKPKLSSIKCSSYEKYEIRKRDPNPKASALLVIDMQNEFSSIAKPILNNVITTINLCRRASVPIFFTRHCHKSPNDHGMLGEWCDGDLIFDGAFRSELIPEIVPLVTEADKVVEKNTYSAFQNTGLREMLVERGVEEVIITGVMTNLCCETTARDAFVKGFRVFFSTDATATSEVELHEATLMNITCGFAYLVDCKRLQQRLFGDELYSN